MKRENYRTFGDTPRYTETYFRKTEVQYNAVADTRLYDKHRDLFDRIAARRATVGRR